MGSPPSGTQRGGAQFGVPGMKLSVAARWSSPQQELQLAKIGACNFVCVPSPRLEWALNLAGAGCHPPSQPWLSRGFSSSQGTLAASRPPAPSPLPVLGDSKRPGGAEQPLASVGPRPPWVTNYVQLCDDWAHPQQPALLPGPGFATCLFVCHLLILPAVI